MAADDLDCTYILKVYHPKTGAYLGKYAMVLSSLIGSDTVNILDTTADKIKSCDACEIIKDGPKEDVK